MIVPIFQMRNRKLFRAVTHSHRDPQPGLNPGSLTHSYTPENPNQEATGPMGAMDMFQGPVGVYYNFYIANIKKLKDSTEGESLKLRQDLFMLASSGVLSISWSSQSDTRFTTTAWASSLPPNSQLDSSGSKSYPESLWETKGKHALVQQAFGPSSPVHSPKSSPLSLLHQGPSPVSLAQARHLEGS